MQAFVLCGGNSTRMGTDKAQLMINGTMMANKIAHQAISAGVESVHMVTKYNRSFTSPFHFIHDHTEDMHPLHGVATALNHSKYPYALILCCDIPWLTASDIKQLIYAPKPCVAISTEALQPLCGVYPKSWEHKATTLAHQHKRVMAFAADCNRVELNAKSLKNVNLPCDLGEHHADS